MAARRPNMKIDVTADTSGLSKGMKESKAAIRDFESSSSGLLSKVGNMFGVNVDAVNKLTSSAQGLGIKMSESGNKGVAAFGKLVASAGTLTTAIAGIGIGGLIASFKLLSEEAANFKSTIQGGMIDTQTKAYLDVYAQVLHDFNSKTGEWAANTGASIEKGFKSGFAKAKSAGVKFITGLFKDPTAGDFGMRWAKAWNEASAQSVVAGHQAEAGSDLAGQMYQKEVEISQQSVVWAEMEAKIAEYKRIAWDKNNDILVQQEALSKATALITQRYNEEARLKRELADLQKQINALASSPLQDVMKENQLNREAVLIDKSRDDALRELSERETGINATLQKQNEEREKAKRLERQLAKFKDFDNVASPALAKTASLPSTLEVPESGAVVAPVHLDTEPAKAELDDLGSFVSDGLVRMAEAFGQLFSDLATGSNAWENFGMTALRSLGDMAVQMGKLAIGVGVTALGIKKALQLSPWAAIAAGAALVALGAAVTSGLGNISNSVGGGGGYVASAGVAQGSYRPSSRNGGTATQSMKVEVTGTLKARGSSLVAVLNNEQERVKHTT